MSDCENEGEELHETFARNFCEAASVNVVSSLSVLAVTEHGMEQNGMTFNVWSLKTTYHWIELNEHYPGCWKGIIYMHWI